MTRSRLNSVSLAAALAVAGVAGGAGVQLLHAQAPAHAAAPATAAAAAPVGGAAAPDFARITREQGPAVVNITVSGTRKAAQSGPDAGDDPMEFFRRFQPGAGGAMPDAPVRGNGSGFIVDANGLILTNAHVVKDATEVTVKLTDRREFTAKVLGSDERTDVAVLKIDAKDLPVVRMGSTRDLHPGDWVLAIGSPFGFENTVTAGVVSAKARALPDGSGVSFLQTDVAINPGNSGGPLFNAKGEVVGINSQIYSRSGGYQGVSFSIPVDLAVRIKDQIVATGSVQHARLGVVVQEVNQALSDSFGLAKPQGALVARVEPSGAADKAGLKAGDVIQSVDGQPIVSSGDLPAQLVQRAPGDSVSLQVWRAGKPVTVEAKLGGAEPQTASTGERADPEASGRLGLAVRPLAAQEQREAGVEGGLRVENAAGAAAKAGVRAGDLIVAANGKAVDSVESLRAAAGDSKNVALLVQRGSQRLFVAVRTS